MRKEIRIYIFILMFVLGFAISADDTPTIRQRVQNYAQLRDDNNSTYRTVINGVGAEMLTQANQQVQIANAIRDDAKALCESDPNLNWEQQQTALGLIEQSITYPDMMIKSQMLMAFERIIEIVRAEMNDEYKMHSIEDREAVANIMTMLAYCVAQMYDPNAVPEFPSTEQVSDE